MKNNITIELTEQEAGIIFDIMHLIGGSCDISARKFTDAIRIKLEDMGIKPIYGFEKRTKHLGCHGTIYMEDDETLFPKPITIGQHEVKNFSVDGFYVGCQHISWETFDKIINESNKYRG
jgi:hypothetical protein